jgi:hypothetical protein
MNWPLEHNIAQFSSLSRAVQPYGDHFDRENEALKPPFPGKQTLKQQSVSPVRPQRHNFITNQSTANLIEK